MITALIIIAFVLGYVAIPFLASAKTKQGSMCTIHLGSYVAKQSAGAYLCGK